MNSLRRNYCTKLSWRRNVSCLAADSTGTHSLYTTYKDYEIMFHVSTMLPYTPNNKQQVSREPGVLKTKQKSTPDPPRCRNSRLCFLTCSCSGSATSGTTSSPSCSRSPEPRPSAPRTSARTSSTSSWWCRCTTHARRTPATGEHPVRTGCSDLNCALKKRKEKTF